MPESEKEKSLEKKRETKSKTKEASGKSKTKSSSGSTSASKTKTEKTQKTQKPAKTLKSKTPSSTKRSTKKTSEEKPLEDSKPTAVSSTAEPPKKTIRVEVVKKADVEKRKAEEAAREAAQRLLEEQQLAREQAQLEAQATQAQQAEEEARLLEERERAAKEAAERAAKEAAERAAREAAEREAKEKAEREKAAREAAERQRLEEEARELAAREAAIREAARELREQEAREKKLAPQRKESKQAGRQEENTASSAKSTPSAPPSEKVKVKVSFPITVGELAPKLNKTPNELIKMLMMQGKLVTINQHLDEESAKKIAENFGVELDVVDPLELQEEKIEKEDPSKLKPRPPVVTVMGHVDHGKTSLLDAIRQTNVTASEEGGITQRIGAYQVELNGRKITFLDTPGHEAFTAMRARGTKITDVAVLVVAADDGVMPQTLEAIDHARAANVPIVVCINKIDKPNANPDRVKQQLAEHGLVPEEWGGNTVFVEVSAKQKIGIEELLEMILLVADLAELKANPDKPARGTIIEAKLDRGKGPVATVLVQEGTLRVGDAFVAGNVYGKIRAFINDRGEKIQEAPPSSPVEIIGLDKVPEAGDILQVVPDERLARQIAEARALHSREQALASLKRITLDDLYQQIQKGEIKELNLILKADGQGSVEALRSSLERLSTDQVRLRIIHAGVGTITESDVMLAQASNAIIIGFNVRPEPHIKNLAERAKVDVRLYRVIYQAIEDITQAILGLHKPTYKENVIGRAEVLQTFKISKVGTIAGCRVVNGKITRDAEVRVIRDGTVVYEGKLASLKRFKDDVREVQAGYECGIGIQNFNDIKEKDVLEAFVMEEVRPTTLPTKVEAGS
jgi:translation initiation factor IF-2